MFALICAIFVFYVHKVALFATGAFGGYLFGHLLFQTFRTYLPKMDFIDQNRWENHYGLVNFIVTAFCFIMFGHG